MADFVCIFCKLKRNIFPEVSLRLFLIFIRRDIRSRSIGGGAEIHKFLGRARVGGEKRRRGEGGLGRGYINNLNQSSINIKEKGRRKLNGFILNYSQKSSLHFCLTFCCLNNRLYLCQNKMLLHTQKESFHLIQTKLLFLVKI